MASHRGENAWYCPTHQHPREHLDAEGWVWTYEWHLAQKEEHRSFSPSRRFEHLSWPLRKEFVVLLLHHLISSQRLFHVQLRSFDVAIHWFHVAFLSIRNQVKAPCRCCREECLDDRGRHGFCRPLHGTPAYPTSSITSETDVKLEHRHTNRQQATDDVAKNRTTVEQWKAGLSLTSADVIHEN